MKLNTQISRRKFLAYGASTMAAGALPGVASTITSDVPAMTAIELSHAIKQRDVSCVEVMQAYLQRLDRVNPSYNAVVSRVAADVLLKEAAACDRELERGVYRGWMHGMPHAVKDLSHAVGLITTSGSPIFKNRVATQDSLHVSRIREAGAIFVGKTNVPEFGLGSQSYNTVFGPTLNPYDGKSTAGGSSGGAAAALRLDLVPVADGSDFMGSLRNPAAFCNVIGFRPTPGLVPLVNSFVEVLRVTDRWVEMCLIRRGC